MKDLEGRTVIVTGGGSGIGRGSVLSFSRAGANVVVADIDEARSSSVADEVRATGAQAEAIRIDVAVDADFEVLRDRALSRFGRVDLVMNNVGVLAAGLPEAIPVAEWQRVFDVNVCSIVRSIHTFLPLLLGQGEGHIVNVASVTGLYPSSYDRLPYASSKAAVLMLSEQLALYTRPQGVGVTCLCPGPVDTNIVEQIHFYGAMSAVRGPGFAMLRAEDVGDMVRQAVQEDRFLLLTHPDEMSDILVRRARDPEGFLDAQVEALR